MGRVPKNQELLPGTLDLLILRRALAARQHARVCDSVAAQASIGRCTASGGKFAVPRFAAIAYLNGWVKAEWGASENNRRARFYTLTAAGRRQLASERLEFERMVGAIQKVLETA